MNHPARFLPPQPEPQFYLNGLMGGIQGNQIFCQSARHTTEKKQNYRLAKPPELKHKQITQPPCNNSQVTPTSRFYLIEKSNKKNLTIDCKPFSINDKIISEKDLVSPEKRQKTHAQSIFQTPLAKSSLFSKSLLTPTITQNTTQRIDSAQSNQGVNVDLMIDELKQELIQGEEGRQQVLEKLKDQIKKDYDFQRELKQNKLDELEQLKDEYKKFCHNIQENNLTQVQLQQENILRMNRIEQLEKQIKSVKLDMRVSEERISQLDSLDTPCQNKFLKEIKQIYTQLEDATDDFCRQYEEDHHEVDAYEILKLY